MQVIVEGVRTWGTEIACARPGASESGHDDDIISSLVRACNVSGNRRERRDRAAGVAMAAEMLGASNLAAALPLVWVRFSSPAAYADRQRTLRIRSPAGALGAVAAACVMVTGCPATVSVPERDEEPVLVVTR